MLYSWDNFREWCISSFSVRNHEKHALQQLEKQRQTGSIAEYKAAHDVLAAQTALPVQMRISWWERGLKDEIKTMCSVDPLTHKEYTNIEKAQSAACACDAHLTFAFAGTNEDDADTDDEELPPSKCRPCYTISRCEHRRCYMYMCNRFGHIANACSWEDNLQGDDAPAKDQLDDDINSQDAANGEQLNVSHLFFGLSL